MRPCGEDRSRNRNSCSRHFLRKCRPRGSRSCRRDGALPVALLPPAPHNQPRLPASRHVHFRPTRPAAPAATGCCSRHWSGHCPANGKSASCLLAGPFVFAGPRGRFGGSGQHRASGWHLPLPTRASRRNPGRSAMTAGRSGFLLPGTLPQPRSVHPVATHRPWPIIMINIALHIRIASVYVFPMVADVA